MISLRKSAVTLVELIIAVLLFSAIMLGIVSFDSASRDFLRSTERRTQVVNETMFILDHISKVLASGAGDITDPGVIVQWELSSGSCSAGSGNCVVDIRMTDPAARPPYSNVWSRYEYDNSSHTLKFYPDRNDSGVFDAISRDRIVELMISSTTDADRIEISSLVLQYQYDGPADDPTNNPVVDLEDVGLNLTTFSQSCR